MKLWLQSTVAYYRWYWLAGLVVWAGVAVVAWIVTLQGGRPFLPTMVTWDEWVSAVLLLPWIWKLGMASFNQMTRGSRMATAMEGALYGASTDRVAATLVEDQARDELLSRGTLSSKFAAVALVVLAMDLVVRAAFGLGWEPFV